MPWMDSGFAASNAEAGPAPYERIMPEQAPDLMRPGLLGRAMTAARIRLTRSVKLRALKSHLAEPVISFTFDDFPRSALTTGGRILSDAGWTGSYYVAGSFCGRRVEGMEYFSREDLTEADRAGHELGCHTFGHLDLARTPRAAILDDLGRNRDFVREVLPQLQLSSFAYPFGEVDLAAKALLARQFPICRGIWGGLNRGWIDFAQLRSVALERRALDEARIESWLDQAMAAKAWLIFFTHDVAERPSPYGCPTDTFARLVASVARRRIKVLTVKNAAALAAAPIEATA